MNMIHYEPWQALRSLRDDVNRMLAGSYNGSEDGSSVVTSRWAPAVDIKEEDDRFLIHADIPGVDPKDIEVTLEHGTLTIRGERKLETKEDEKGYRRVERLHGSFYRRFTLPDTADPEKVVATGRNGVLEVVIPKQAAVQPKRISVSS